MIRAVLILLLLSMPVHAQSRVFRASSIDLEQDRRLDDLERQVQVLATWSGQLQSKVAQLERPVETFPTSKPVQVKPPVVVTVPAKPYAVITIESLPGCDPCNRWKSKEAVELRAQGWTVVEVPLTSASSAPFFRICIGDRCYTHHGFMSHGILRGILAKVRGNVQARQDARQNARSSWYSTSELRAMIQAKRPGGWRGPVYADVSPRSNVKQHLVGPEHGFSWEQVNGLTQDEALILHDLAPRHGNQIFPTR